MAGFAYLNILSTVSQTDQVGISASVLLNRNIPDPCKKLAITEELFKCNSVNSSPLLPLICFKTYISDQVILTLKSGRSIFPQENSVNLTSQLIVWMTYPTKTAELLSIINLENVSLDNLFHPSHLTGIEIMLWKGIKYNKQHLAKSRS